MRKKTYQKEMSKLMSQINKRWEKMVDITNRFVQKNEEMTFDSMTSDADNVEKIADDFIFKGVWLYQRVDGDDKLRTRIRKAMNYSYP